MASSRGGGGNLMQCCLLLFNSVCIKSQRCHLAQKCRRNMLKINFCNFSFNVLNWNLMWSSCIWWNCFKSLKFCRWATRNKVSKYIKHQYIYKIRDSRNWCLFLGSYVMKWFVTINGLIRKKKNEFYRILRGCCRLRWSTACYQCWARTTKKKWASPC